MIKLRKIFAFVLCFFIFANICSANENFVKNYVAFPSDISVEFNNKSFSRVLAIGDIHGQFTRFNSMYEKVGVNDKDLVIFLGDYIKGYKVGEDLKTVLWLMEKAKQDNFIFLSGNMERNFLRECFDETGNLKENKKWALSQELLNTHDNELIKKVYDFFSTLKFYQEINIGDKVFVFCHAGIKDDLPLNELTEFDLMYNKNFYQEYNGKRFVVIGHRPVQVAFGKDHTVPVKVEGKNILMIDTRCKRKKGYSSCVNVLTGEFWQSSELSPLK